MNIKIWGIAKLKSNKFSTEQIQACFCIQKKAIQNKIGIRFGCNVSPDFKEKFKNNFAGIIPFELLDSPIDTNANFLFGLNTEEESLSSRMLRVQNFLQEIRSIKHIDTIILDINPKNDEPAAVKIDAEKFHNKMIDLYEQESNSIPSIRMFIK